MKSECELWEFDFFVPGVDEVSLLEVGDDREHAEKKARDYAREAHPGAIGPRGSRHVGLVVDGSEADLSVLPAALAVARIAEKLNWTSEDLASFMYKALQHQHRFDAYLSICEEFDEYLTMRDEFAHYRAARLHRGSIQAVLAEADRVFEAES